MSKNKKNTKDGETSEPVNGSSLPEDKPEQVNMAPPVQDSPAKADVLKRGIAMERVDSPRYGVPGQATATRAAAGGGAFNPSAQAGRTPSNPEMRGPGSDPLNKMDIRDELSWNDIGAQQFRTLIDGSPAGFVPDAVLGNFTYEDNLVFQFDNAGTRPGTINSPYRRRVESVSKDQIIFAMGQHDSAAKQGMSFYPAKTYAKEGLRNVIDVVAGATRGNYLTRGMVVNIAKDGTSYKISSIHFDVDALECSSSADDLDVRQDNARVIFDVADRDITENFFALVNKQENLAANKFSPLPDGQPDAIQHLILSRDIACVDGTIAMAACRSVIETYAYHRSMRAQYGAGDGATAQTRFMLSERLAQSTESAGMLWHDDENMSGSGSSKAESVGSHNLNWIRLTASEYIQTFLDSPRKYNANFGTWVTQPRGLKLVFEEMQKAFDEGAFVIDKDTYAIMDQCLGWHKYNDRLCGVNRFGLVLPLDLNALYEQDGDGNIPTDQAGTIHSKYTYIDYVLNGSFYNKTEVRSVLVDAILQAVRYRIIPKLEKANEFNIYIPFDFACDHYSFGHMVLMEAMPYMHQYIHPARAVFQRFKDMYGVDPIMCDLIQELRLADVMKSSGYKGIGTDPSFPEAGEALKLIMATPEVYQAAAMTWDSALELPDALFAIKFTDIAPISDSAEDPAKVLFPMLYQTMVLSQWRALKDLGPEKLLRSRDYPIHRYAMKGDLDRDDKSWSTVGSDPKMPFFGLQRPQVYHTGSISGCEIKLTVGDILKAPRYGGRIAPAPAGLLDFVRAPESMSVGKFSEYHLEQASASGTTRYGWLAKLDDPIISFKEVSGDMVYTGKDIENYRVDFVYMPTFEMSQLGTLLKRYFVHFTSGALTQDQISELSGSYGVWISPDQQSVNLPSCGASFAPSENIVIPAAVDEVAGTVSFSARYTIINITGQDYSLDSTASDYVGTTYPSLTVSTSGVGPLKRTTISNTGSAVEAIVKETVHSISMLYENDAMKMWVNDNIFEFISSPFSGNAEATLDDNADQYVEVDHDVTNALIFGFAGYQELWYDRLNVSIYAFKQAAGGRIYSNEILHQNNIFFG